MNVDELRTALHEPPPPLSVDLDRVVARGRRRTAVRRSALPAAVLAVAAVVAAPTLMPHNGRPDVETATPPAATVGPVVCATAAQDAGVTVKVGAPTATRLGDVVRTGQIRGGLERVFAFSRYPDKGGHGRLIGGERGQFLLSETWAEPRGGCLVGFEDPPQGGLIASVRYGPGFQAVYQRTNVPNGSHHDWSVYGWYAGPAAKVTATIGGKRVITARLVHQNVGKLPVTLFWFSADTGAPLDPPSWESVGNVTAYDARGRVLPPPHLS